eukprot:673551-Prymnesium_polylepis.1
MVGQAADTPSVQLIPSLTCKIVYQPLFVPRGKRAAVPPASPTVEGAFAHGRSRRMAKKSAPPRDPAYI